MRELNGRLSLKYFIKTEINMLRRVKIILGLVGLLAITLVIGCSKYSTYDECRLVEEKEGATEMTAAHYCWELVKKGEISR